MLSLLQIKFCPALYLEQNFFSLNSYQLQAIHIQNKILKIMFDICLSMIFATISIHYFGLIF